MPTGEPPHKIKGSAPMYLPHKVVWKKYICSYGHISKIVQWLRIQPNIQPCMQLLMR